MDKQAFLELFPELVKNYRPAVDVLQKIGSIDLLIIIGPSGVGKTTVIRNIGLPFTASDVTRSARPEEVDGVDYHFRTDYGQIVNDIKGGRFVQIAVSPDGEFYATRESSYPPSGPAVMAVVADVVPVFRRLGFNRTISAFITPPSFEEWMNRMKTHELSSEQLVKRLVEAKRSLSFALSDDQTHFILSDEVGATLAQTKGLLSAKPDLQREESARDIASQLLQRLEQNDAQLV
ncbi:MAG: guanylate kinase [Candidatus Saccharibacteria bacterium]|nr:guanylate kinase [Candidatus Saccharibacteria bacterium]